MFIANAGPETLRYALPVATPSTWRPLPVSHCVTAATEVAEGANCASYCADERNLRNCELLGSLTACASAPSWAALRGVSQTCALTRSPAASGALCRTPAVHEGLVPAKTCRPEPWALAGTAETARAVIKRVPKSTSLRRTTPQSSTQSSLPTRKRRAANSSRCFWPRKERRVKGCKSTFGRDRRRTKGLLKVELLAYGGLHQVEDPAGRSADDLRQ